jgi:hypothetical protein
MKMTWKNFEESITQGWKSIKADRYRTAEDSSAISLIFFSSSSQFEENLLQLPLNTQTI